MKVKSKRRRFNLFFCGLFLFAKTAAACTCAPWDVLWDDRLPFVFDAEIVSTEMGASTSNAIPVEIMGYRVIEKFRGDHPPKELQTVLDAGACGIRVMPGDIWLLHTDQRGRLSLCSTRRIYPTIEKDKELLQRYRE